MAQGATAAGGFLGQPFAGFQGQAGHGFAPGVGNDKSSKSGKKKKNTNQGAFGEPNNFNNNFKGAGGQNRSSGKN